MRIRRDDSCFGTGPFALCSALVPPCGPAWCSVRAANPNLDVEVSNAVRETDIDAAVAVLVEVDGVEAEPAAKGVASMADSQGGAATAYWAKADQWDWTRTAWCETRCSHSARG